MNERTYHLPDTEFLDVTPELIARLLDDLPEHTEGDIAITVQSESFKALLEATGATVLKHHEKGEG